MRWMAAAALGAVLLAGCDSSTGPDEDLQTFVLEVSGEQFRVRTGDAEVIAQLEARMAAGTEGVVSGRLLRGNGGWNTPWSWRLDPATVHAPDLSIELCDGRPSMVEEDLDYWVGTVKQFCPWGARVVRKEAD